MDGTKSVGLPISTLPLLKVWAKVWWRCAVGIGVNRFTVCRSRFTFPLLKALSVILNLAVYLEITIWSISEVDIGEMRAFNTLNIGIVALGHIIFIVLEWIKLKSKPRLGVMVGFTDVVWVPAEVSRGNFTSSSSQRDGCLNTLLASKNLSSPTVLECKSLSHYIF